VADITAADVKRLRDLTGAGMMDSKRALQEADGDTDRAVEILREKGMASVGKRAGRRATQGRVESYIHFNATVGSLVEVNCETDFVANTDEFRQLARDLALHVASPSEPKWLRREDVPVETIESTRHIFDVQAKEMGKPEAVTARIVDGKMDAFLKENVLLEQPFVKDDSKTIQELLDEVGAKTGENVVVTRFARFRLGEVGDQGAGER
jgi:elongation factor Ts